MPQENQIDLGTIQIHKKAIADIAFSAISDMDGVHLIPNDFKASLKELLGYKDYSGIIVQVDSNNLVSIELKLCLRYGMNVPEVAREVQDVVRVAVERTAEVNLKDVRVNILGIEKGDL